MGGTQKESLKDWGLGGLLILEDQPDGKAAFTCVWGGMPNLVSNTCRQKQVSSNLSLRSGGWIAGLDSAASTQDKLCQRVTQSVQPWIATSRLQCMNSTRKAGLNLFVFSVCALVGRQGAAYMKCAAMWTQNCGVSGIMNFSMIVAASLRLNAWSCDSNDLISLWTLRPNCDYLNCTCL